MQALYKMTFTETKLFLREPIAVFFNLALTGNVSAALRQHLRQRIRARLGRDLRMVDVMAPAYTGFVIGSIGLIGLPINLAEYRQHGHPAPPERHPGTSPGRYSTAQVLTQLLMTALGITLLLMVARVVYGLKMPEAPLALVPAFVLASLSFFARRAS